MQPLFWACLLWEHLPHITGDTTIATVIQKDGKFLALQGVLDGILPKMIPLAITVGLFFLMKKKKNWKPVTCIALLLLLGLVGAFFGVFA